MTRPAAADPIEKAARVTPDVVKGKLRYAGDITHGLGISYFGLDTPEAKKYLSEDLTRDLFRFTADELEAIAPALANLANRHAVVSRIVEQSDEGVIALVVARSAVRNFTDLRAAAAIIEAYAPAPPEGGEGGLEAEVETVPSDPRSGSGAGAAGGREAGG